ncbi:MAG: hypothetical protein R8L07_13075 [Alphaproteobacteria bacterium]|nr:hypothetical protein [Alphaproteobacteria bacterium]
MRKPSNYKKRTYHGLTRTITSKERTNCIYRKLYKTLVRISSIIALIIFLPYISLAETKNKSDMQNETRKYEPFVNEWKTICLSEDPYKEIDVRIKKQDILIESTSTATNTMHLTGRSEFYYFPNRTGFKLLIQRERGRCGLIVIGGSFDGAVKLLNPDFYSIASGYSRTSSSGSVYEIGWRLLDPAPTFPEVRIVCVLDAEFAVILLASNGKRCN